MTSPDTFSHVAVPADLFRAVHAYLGQRPAAETARLLLALEASPACNIGPQTSGDAPALDEMPKGPEPK